MKNCLLGQMGRITSAIVVVLFVLTCLISSALPATAGTGGRQSIRIVPFTNEADNAPAYLALEAQSMLQVALMKRPGVQVDTLGSVRELTWAAGKQTEADKALVLSSYEIIKDSAASSDDRMKAAATLILKLGVDAVVYGSIDGYNADQNAKVAKVQLAATIVTIARQENGVPKLDDNGDVIPLASSYRVKGESSPRVNNQLSQRNIDNEAITYATTDMAGRLMGRPTATQQAASSGNGRTVDQPSTSTKKKSNTWLWALLGLGVVVLVASGSNGDDGGVPPAQTVVAQPTAVYTTLTSVDGSNGTDFNMLVRWNMPDQDIQPYRYEVYRSDSAAPVKVGVKGVGRASGAIGMGLPTRHPQSAPRVNGDGRHKGRSNPAAAIRTAPMGFIGQIPFNEDPIFEPTRQFIDTDIEANRTYTYTVVAVYRDANGLETFSLETFSTPKHVQTPGGDVQNLTAENLTVGVKLNWNAPADMPVGAKYKVFRGVQQSATATHVTSDQLAGFTEITPAAGLPWASSVEYVDALPIDGATDCYVVQAYDTTGKPAAGPFAMAKIDVPRREFKGKVIAYTATMDSDTKKQRVYYSVDTADQLSDAVRLSTEVMIRGYSSTTDSEYDPTDPIYLYNAAAYAVVKVTTDKGSFVAKDGQVLVDSKTLVGRLDAEGKMFVTFQGRAEDLSRETFKAPTRDELKTAKFAASCNGDKALTVTGTLPVLVGPPHSIEVDSYRTTVPDPLVHQEDSLEVIFQKTTMTFAVNVADIAGQPVLANMPIWFGQAWTPLTDDMQVGSVGYFEASKGAGAIDWVKGTDEYGNVSTAFTSWHSGKYKLYAYALKKYHDTAILGSLNKDVPENQGGLTPTSKQLIQTYLLQTGAGADIYTTYDILCKTFPFRSNWHIKDVSHRRLNCSDQDQSSTITVYAEDEDGKRVLPGTFFQVHPVRSVDGVWRLDVAGTLETSEGGIATPVGDSFLKFNSKSETSVILRGNQWIGDIHLRFDSPLGSQSNCTTDEKVVTMYGPSLGEAVDISGSSYWSAIRMTKTNLEEYPRIGGEHDGRDGANSVDITISLRDEDDNPFPGGYRVRVTSQSYLALGIPYQADGETDKDGLFQFTYNGPCTIGYNHQLKDDLIITIIGENRTEREWRSTDPAQCSANIPKFDSNNRIVTEHPSRGNFTVIQKEKSFVFVFQAQNTDGTTSLAGYPIIFTVQKLSGPEGDYTANPEDGVTNGDGQVSTEVSFQSDPGRIRVTAYGTGGTHLYSPMLGFIEIDVPGTGG